MKPKLITTEISIPGSSAPTKLTPKEKAAAEAFLEAAQKLPESISVSLKYYAAPNESHLVVYKRVTRNFSVFVGGIRKRSLLFP